MGADARVLARARILVHFENNGTVGHFRPHPSSRPSSKLHSAHPTAHHGQTPPIQRRQEAQEAKTRAASRPRRHRSQILQSLTTTSATVSGATENDDDFWVTADTPTDISGPIL